MALTSKNPGEFVNAAEWNELLPRLTDYATPSEADGSMIIEIYGDSYSFGTGSATTFDFPGGFPWGEMLSAATGYKVNVHGYPGKKSSDILGYFNTITQANPEFLKRPHIFWCGANDGAGNLASIKTNIQAMISKLGHSMYLVIGILGQQTPTFYSGTSDYNAVAAYNTDGASTYGEHFYNPRPAVLAVYNPTIAQDVTNHNNGVPAASLMADETHLNLQGYLVHAKGILPKMPVLLPTVNKTMSTGLMAKLLGAVNRSEKLRYLFLNGFDALPVIITNADNGQSLIPIASRGGMRFMHTHPAAAPGGIDIKDGFQDFVGSAEMEISGTGAAWTPGKGVTFHNSFASILFGADEVKFVGVVTFGGEIYAGRINAGTLYASKFVSANSYPGDSVLDVSKETASSLIVAVINNALMNGWRGGSSLGGGLPKQGEVVYNNEANKFFYGALRTDQYNTTTQWYAIANEQYVIAVQTALQAQINVLAAGAPSDKLTGTPFGSPAASAAGPGHDVDKVFDGTASSSNYWTTEAGGGHFCGIDLGAGTSKVLTKMRLYPYGGSDYTGMKIQGSNTSSTAGFVDLYTFPGNPPSFQWSEVDVPGTTAYRYFRLLEGPNSYVMAMSEVEFYGRVVTYTTTELKAMIDQINAKWTTANRPATPAEGTEGYNLTDHKKEYWNGTAWIQY